MIKLGVDSRHRRLVSQFVDDWNKTEEPIDLEPRRVLDGCKVLARDKVSGKYWLLWRERWSVSGYEITYQTAMDFVAESQKNTPAHAEVFKNNNLYAVI